MSESDPLDPALAARRRDTVLGAIRRNLGRDAAPPAPEFPMTPAHPRLAVPEEDLVERWRKRWEARGGTSALVPTKAAAVEHLVAWCREHGLPAPTHAARPLLELPWPADWHLDPGPAGIDTQSAVSLAFAGIAEVGTLAFLSGPESPVTHLFVPDNHFILLDAATIVRHFEDLWQRLRHHLAPAGGDWRERLPRTINFVAGPSRTGDVEQTIQLGAHGPRRVHVVVIHGVN
ncbi:LutC/YkgG family protein [Tepidiphilus sp. HLB4]